jgi:hypothetical protein
VCDCERRFVAGSLERRPKRIVQDRVLVLDKRQTSVQLLRGEREANLALRSEVERDDHPSDFVRTERSCF